MPKAIKGDHNIITAQATSYADAATRARPSSTTSVPPRKTPSPKPPSPTTSSSGAPPRTARGTPSPPPPPMLSSRSSMGFTDRERRSPKSTERHSPTQPPKTASSPTEAVKALKVGQGRSFSTSTTPTPPATGHPSPRFAPLGPRSKSSASEAITCSRVGTEARKPMPRRPEATVETRDSYTQTEGNDVGVDAWADLEADALDESVSVESDGGAASGANEFLSQHIRMQAELEMALRSQMEMIAERPHTALPAPDSVPHPTEPKETATSARRNSAPFASFGPSPPLTTRPMHAGRRQLAALRPLGSAKKGEKDADGSDGENHPEDDEVKSLSLSEDGPVIRRSFSEGAGGFFGRDRVAAAAPDPIAMLTDGTRKAMLSFSNAYQNALGVVGSVGTNVADLAHVGAPASAEVGINDGEAVCSADGEAQSSDRSAPNESDHSAAPTHYAEAQAPASDGALYKNLMQSLSKVTGTASSASSEPPPQGQLKVVQEGVPGVASTSSCGTSTATLMRREWKPAKSLRVPALRSATTNVKALDLSQIRSDLPPLGANAASDRNVDTRSDVSFGSAQSAFTCWSSSSPTSSQVTSPRAQHGSLKTTVSMPALTPRSVTK